MNATVPTPERTDPETWGWELDPYSNQLKPKLLLLEPIPKVCTELLQCGCKVCATIRCKCRSNNLKCLPSCGCGSITCGNPLNNVEDIWLREGIYSTLLKLLEMTDNSFLHTKFKIFYRKFPVQTNHAKMHGWFRDLATYKTYLRTFDPDLTSYEGIRLKNKARSFTNSYPDF